MMERLLGYWNECYSIQNKLTNLTVTSLETAVVCVLSGVKSLQLPMYNSLLGRRQLGYCSALVCVTLDVPTLCSCRCIIASSCLLSNSPELSPVSWSLFGILQRFLITRDEATRWLSLSVKSNTLTTGEQRYCRTEINNNVSRSKFSENQFHLIHSWTEYILHSWAEYNDHFCKPRAGRRM